MTNIYHIGEATSVARRGGSIGFLPVERATQAPGIADWARDRLDPKLRQI